MSRLTLKKTTGFTLVEMLVVIAVTVLIFGALFSSFQYTLRLAANSKAKVSAVSLANDRMEYFRSLPYDDVGTVAGIPSGVIPQQSTTTLNDIEFSERIIVEYVDDPADGQLTATTTDDNGIPADYKRIKIEISWTIYNQTDQIVLVSNIVPKSIESTDGGGTVRVNVIDADSVALAGASVRLLNNTTTTTIDVTKFTDSSGTVLFSGAPAASDYQVFVTAAGYSSDQTYEATTTNPNPITAPFAVLESDISTVTFQIGELSDIYMRTFASITDNATTEEFDDMSGIATSTELEIVSGALALKNTGTYAPSGVGYLTTISPAPFLNWEAVTIAATAPVGTEYRVHFYTVSSSTYTLIPEVDLSGNAVGFLGPIIDISNLDSSTYGDLVVGVTLTTTDTTETPSIDQLAVYYREAESPRASVSLDLHGNKIIGTELDATPIYKVALSTATDGSGELLLSDVEFDTYTIDIPASLVMARACPASPLVHVAGVDSTVELELVSSVTNSLRVSVRDGGGQAIPGASVNVTRAGYDTTVSTDGCGQAFFSSGVTANSDYVITVTKPGFDTVVVNPFDVSGNTSSIIVMIES